MYSADEKLVSQTLTGDREAFGVLVHKYQDMVYTYAFQKVRNEADAQDITQEVFIRAYRRLFKLRHPHLFRTWLYTIMSNECKRWMERVMKKRKREIILEEAAEDALKIEPPHTEPVEDWQVDLEKAMAALSDENRVAVSMFYMGDCSLKEISEFLGVSVNTVKGKLHRARRQLGGAMSRHYGRLLTSHKLRAGFLMQIMEQIRYVPAPAIGFAWSSAAVGKSLVSLIMALCILVGLARVRSDLPTSSSEKQFASSPSVMNRLPIEVAHIESVPYSTPSSVSGIPSATGKRPLAASNRVSIEPSDRSIGGRNGTSAENGGEPQNSRFSAVMTEEAAERLTFSGRVVDSGGEPVADAEVLYSLQSNPPKYAARTSEDGLFKFGLPRPESEERDRVDIVAVHAQHASGWRNLPTLSTANVEIQLEKPTIISGRIMNTAGEPVQNAEVQLKEFLRDNLIYLGLDDHSVLNLIPIAPVKSDSNGNFIFRRLPQGRTATLSVQGEGYAREMQDAVLTGTKGLEFKLEREARIEGRLSYEDSGTPVESATISIESIRPTAAGGRASVDEHGHYAVRNLPPGTYNMYLEEGPAGWTAAANAVVKVAEGQTASKVDMTLVRVGYVTGRVTDRGTNEPIANYDISMYDAARPAPQKRSHSMQTDESGTYRFSAAPGSALIFGSPPRGYQDVDYIDENVHVVEGETLVINFQFSKGTPSTFRTLTETGDPVTGARITDSFGGRRDYGKSNEHGELTVHGLRPGQRLVLTAEQTELKLRGSAEVEFQPGAPAEIRMNPFKLVKISGRVVNSDGEPIPSAIIHRHRSDPLRHTVIVSGIGVTNGDGWFRDVGLIAGVQYVITAKAKGYWREVTEEFTATEGMSQFDDFVLRPAIGQFSIEGRIIDTSGNPVSGARLESTQQGQYWETFTDANGDYRLENLPMVVLYQLEITHPDYAHHTLGVLKTDQRHDIVLDKADGYLAGKVVAADGEPVDHATVRIEPRKDPASGAVYSPDYTNREGEFELKYIKGAEVSIYVGTGHQSQVFEGIKVNQRDLVFTLDPIDAESVPRPEWGARRAHAKEAERRLDALAGKPAPELAVEKWLSGSSATIGHLKGKTIALDFWASDDFDNVQSVRLLNVLQEVYQEKGLVCVTICPAKADVDTIKQQIAEHTLTYSIGLDSPTDVPGAKGETFDRYAIGGRGSIVLINAAGEITGSVFPGNLEDRIQKLFTD